MKSTITKFFNSYRGVVVFSGLKYLEILITAVTTFYMAQKIGAVEMGKAIPVLLYITYSSYLSLGVNQVIIKNFSKLKKDSIKFNFLKINFQFILIVSILGFFGAYLFVTSGFFLFTGLICVATLIKSYYISYFRVCDKIWVLNKNNIVFSVALLLFTIFMVNSWLEYLMFWALSLWISLFLYLYDARNLLLKVMFSFFKPIKWKLLTDVLSDGLKLAFLGGVTTVFLTLDRLLISNFNIDLSLKGTYQLADYVGMAIYMVITTVLFYYYPILIKKLRESLSFRNYFITKINIFFFFIFPFSAFMGLLVWCVQNFVFQDYIDLPTYVFLNVIIKLLILAGTSYSVIYISMDQETSFIKSSLPAFIMAVILIIISFFTMHISLLFIVISVVCLILLDFVYKSFLIRAAFKNE
jgi:O-antigen/teichoic acid export membrane protein